MIHLLMLSGNGFEAGLEAPEGDLAGVTDLGESLKFLLGDVTNRKNHLRNRIFLKDILQGIERPKDRIAIHLLALIPKIVIDKTDRL